MLKKLRLADTENYGAVMNLIVDATLDSTAFFDTCSFTSALTKIEQAGTANLTVHDDLHLLKAGRMQGKGFFNTNAVGDLCER